MPRRLTDWLLAPALLAMLLGPVRAPAAEPLRGEVRFTAAQAEPAWVGQEVELHLELWSDGFSFGDQLFVLPEVPGGFLLQGDSSTVKLSENRSGVAWQGLRYTLLFYPQSAGRLEVPPFDVGFTARAGFGSQPAAFRFRTEPLALEVRRPAGTGPGDLLVTTTGFTLEASWDRDVPAEGPLLLQAGDALTLEVRRRAADVPGMLFVPLPEPRIAGLGVYAEAPRVDDAVNRGELSGERTDRITFICEKAGRYEIPEWRFQWWDPVQQRLAARVIPALALEVAVNPAYGPAAGAPAEPFGDRGYAIALAAVLAALAMAAAWRRFSRGGEPRSAVAPVQAGRRTGRLLPLNPRRSSE
jgi:hypothetical protein